MEIIISSGGNKGISLLGALNEFSIYNPIEKFKYLTGCSFGAIICLLLNINYKIEELNDILFKINFKEFQDCKIINLIEKCGLDEGIKFTNFLKAIILNKNYHSNITFKELYDLTGKILTIVVVNITKGIPEYHNYITTPDLSILLSVRMSANIPILFSPIFYNNNYYIDGGLLDPFPYYYHKNTEKFGFWLFSNYEFNFIKNNEVTFFNDINNSIKYIIDLLKIVHINYIKKNYKKIPKNVIYINFELKNLDIDDFDIKIEDKLIMYNIGKKKVNIYLKKLNKKKREKCLLHKYFSKWKLYINAIT